MNKDSTRSGIDLTIPPVFLPLFGGLLSGTLSCVLFQPLEVVKTRLQNAQQKQNFSTFFITGQSSVSKEVQIVFEQNGFRGFFKGLQPALLRTVPGVGLYFAVFHFTKDVLTASNRDLSAFETVFLGVGCRSVVATSLFPFTVVKTRLESGLFTYQSLYLAFQEIFRRDGVRGLWRGYISTVLRDAPYSGIYLLSYTHLRSLLGLETCGGHFDTKDAGQNFRSLSNFANFSVATAAGVIASVLTHPPDVVRTRLQLHSSKRYGGSLWKVACAIYMESGPSGFLAGLLPRMARKAMMSALGWTVYEEMARRVKARS